MPQMNAMTWKEIWHDTLETGKEKKISHYLNAACTTTRQL